MLGEFSNALKLLTEMLDALEWAAMSSVEQLKTLRDIILSTSTGKEVRMKEKNWNLQNLTLNHGVKSLDNEDRGAGTALYSSTRHLLLECMHADSGQV